MGACRSFGFLAVPSKKSGVSDWSKEIKRCLIELDEDVSGFGSEIESLNKQRTDMQGAEANATGLGLIYRYYSQLESMMHRLSGLQKPKEVIFEWCDAFDSETKIRQSSLAFEKANLAFNLASLCSKIATAMVPGEATFASMAQYYQAAGSVFSWMSETFLHPPLVDLQAASLRFLSCLMLAQAQECVLLKASGEGKSAGTLSRLSAALTLRYERCAGLLQCPEGQSLAASLSHGCRVMTEGKALYYGALAAQWRADTCADGDGHGEAVARQLHAIHLLERLSELDAESGVFGDVDALVEIASKRHEQLEHENGFIYHLAVPEVKSLKPIEAADLTRCLGFRDVLRELGIDRYGVDGETDLFRRVLPQRALEDLSLYSEETAKLLRYETGKVEAADEELEILQIRLCSLENDSDGTESSPVKQIQAQIAALPPLEDSLQTAKSQLSQIKVALEHCKLLKIEDERMQMAMRSKYGATWSQPPLAQSEDFQSRVDKTASEIQELIDKHDRQVAQSLHRLIDRIARLDCKPSSALLDAQEEEPSSHEIKKSVDALNRLAVTRAALLSKLKDAISDDDISDRLLHPQQSKSTELFEAELRKFDGLCDEIEGNVSEHTKLKKTIEEHFADEERKDIRNRASLGLDEIERGMATIQGAASQIAKAMGLSGLQSQVLKQSEELTETVERRRSEAERLGASIEGSSAFRTQQLLRAKLSSLDISTGESGIGPNMSAPKTAGNQPNATFEPSLLD